MAASRAARTARSKVEVVVASSAVEAVAAADSSAAFSELVNDSRTKIDGHLKVYDTDLKPLCLG